MLDLRIAFIRDYLMKPLMQQMDSVRATSVLQLRRQMVSRWLTDFALRDPDRDFIADV